MNSMKRVVRSWWSPVVFAFALTGAAGLACSDARAGEPGLDTALSPWQRPAQPGIPPGAYVLREVDIEDHAGNTGRYPSTAFGGTTDFGPIFDTTTVVVTP
jgi:hypothetical protein